VLMNARLFGLVIATLLFSCSQPEGPEPPPPVKASFTWRLDTLRPHGASMFVMTDAYGTSDGSVYVSSTGNGGWREMLWKYSDSVWTPIELNKKYGGPLDGTVSLIGNLDGAEGNRVWLAGARLRDSLPHPVKLEYGFLASYDGKQFKEINLYYEPMITCLDVVADDDIWFGSHGPWIYHYDGADVRKIALPMQRIEALAGRSSERIAVNWIAALRDEVFAVVSLRYDQGGTTKVQLKLQNGNEWHITDIKSGSDLGTGGGMSSFWRSPEGKLYSGGDQIYRRDQGVWTPIHRTLISANHVFGASDRDIWAVGTFNNVARCVDGVWRANVFFRIPDVSKSTTWITGWSDGNRVFIVGNPDDDAVDYGVVAHGK